MMVLGAMPKYEVYKDSGVEWLGDIPNEWNTVRIKYLFNEINNKDTSGNEELLSVSQYTGVTKKSDKVATGELLTNAESLEGYKQVAKGDLVSNIMLAWNGSLGFSSFDGITSPAYSVYRLQKNQSERYFHYLLRTDLYKAEFKRRSSGVIESRLRLYSDDFFDILSILPSEQEQATIATFLDEKTAQIDEAIAIKQKQIELLKERKQIIIQKAVTQGLDPNVPLRDSGVVWIGKIPENWSLVAMKFITDVRDGTHDTPVYIEQSENSRYLITSKDFENEDVNFKNAKNISIKDHKEIIKRSLVETNDVLMSMIGGNIGKSLIVKEFSDFSIKNVAIFKTHGDLSLAKFIKYYLISGLLEKQILLNSRGGAQPFLSLSDIRSLIFFKLPIDEMNNIVNLLDQQIVKINGLEKLNFEQIKNLKEYKTTLINSAVTGKIKISETQLDTQEA